MIKLITLLLVFTELTSHAGLPPVSFNPVGSAPNIYGASVIANRITLQPADASFPGILLSADWNAFNSKQGALIFTSPLVNTAGTVAITSSASTFAGFDATGNLNPIPNWAITTEFGASVGTSVDELPQAFNNFNINVVPTAPTTGNVRTIQNLYSALDPTNTGNDIGDPSDGNGGVTLLNLGADHAGSSAGVGQLNVVNGFSNLGDGTIAAHMHNYNTFIHGEHIYNNYTLDQYTAFGDYSTFDSGSVLGGLNGLQLNMTMNGSVTSFADPISVFMNVGPTANIAHYHGLEMSVQGDPANTGVVSDYIGGNLYINHVTSTGMTGYEFSADTDTTSQFTGFQLNTSNFNADNYQGINLNTQDGSPSTNFAFMNTGIGTRDITNFQGININAGAGSGSNMTLLNLSGGTRSATNVTGINVDLHDVVSSQQKTGVSINDGTLNVGSNYDTSVLSASPGEWQHNIIGGGFKIAPGHPMTNSFGFGNNLGVTLDLEDDMGVDPTGVRLGYSVNGFVNQIGIVGGKTIDTINYMAAGGGVVPQSTGGTVDQLIMFRALGLLGEGGTLVATNMYGFRADNILCSMAGSGGCWGVSIMDPAADNSFAKSVIVGAVDGKATNASVGIELKGTTSALRPSLLTTTQRNALTALEGMVIENTTTHTLQYYNGTSWVNSNDISGTISVSQILLNGATAGTNTDIVAKNGHIKSTQTTAPTATVQASAGTGASCSVANATDTAGQISITTGTVGLSTGGYCKVNFNLAYGVAPICMLTPASSTLSTNVYVTSTVNDATVNFAIAGGVTSTYLINYNCIETQ